MLIQPIFPQKETFVTKSTFMLAIKECTRTGTMCKYALCHFSYDFIHLYLFNLGSFYGEVIIEDTNIECKPIP